MRGKPLLREIFLRIDETPWKLTTRSAMAVREGREGGGIVWELGGLDEDEGEKRF